MSKKKKAPFSENFFPFCSVKEKQSENISSVFLFIYFIQFVHVYHTRKVEMDCYIQEKK
jgi:hypothetical protein